MLKISKLMLLIYCSAYVQPYTIMGQKNDPAHEEVMGDFTDDLDAFFIEEASLPIVEPKIMIPKRTRYVHLQNKFFVYGITIFIYYLQMKEWWYSFCGRINKKMDKMICYLFYCS